MDYMTKSTTRVQIREFAIVFRKMFSVPLSGKFPVLESLEKMHDIFPGSYYVILDDDELPVSIPAQCVVSSDGTFEIQIRQSTYQGAYEKHVGAFMDHILHEMCHIFLYKIGFTPIMERSFENGELDPYMSSEWQAKALCGEIMMPYEETIGLTEEELVKKYGVSPSQAKYRLKY